MKLCRNIINKLSNKFLTEFKVFFYFSFKKSKKKLTETNRRARRRCRTNRLRLGLPAPAGGGCTPSSQPQSGSLTAMRAGDDQTLGARLKRPSLHAELACMTKMHLAKRDQWESCATCRLHQSFKAALVAWNLQASSMRCTRCRASWSGQSSETEKLGERRRYLHEFLPA